MENKPKKVENDYCEADVNKAFESVINHQRYVQDQLLFTQLPDEIRSSEEFLWYSKIKLAVDNKELLTGQEKLTFMAMHRTFLQLI